MKIYQEKVSKYITKQKCVVILALTSYLLTNKLNQGKLST